LVYFLACGRGRVPADGEQPTLALFRVIQALTGTAPVRRPLTLTVVLAGAVPVGDGEVRPHAAGLPGLVGSLAAEYPQWTVGCVDVGTGRWNTDELVRLLRREPGTDRLVAIRGGRRLVRVLEPARLPAGTVPARLSAGTVPAGGPFRPGGTYLIVGGTGGIGQVLSRYLARTVHARLAIVGRRLPDERSAALLAEIERLGGRAVYLPADVTDPAALRAVVRHTRRTFGALHGAFHAALVLRDRTLARMDEDELAEVLAPKVAGAVAFGEAMCTERLDFLAFFSSAVSFTDAAGQANYAAASTFEDAYAMDLRRRYRTPVSVVNWGYWGGVGVVADERYAQRLAGFGVGSIAPAEGMAALCALLHHDVPQALVVKANPDGLARLGVEPAAQPVRPATGSPAAQPVRPAAAPDDPTARAREAFTALDALAPVLLAQRLREPLSVPATVAELAARLHVRPEQERLFAAVLELLERSGAVRRAGDRLEPGTATPPALSTPEALGVRYPDLAPHIELLQRCIDALPDVLDGSRGATGVLFPGGSTDLIERVYSGQSSADHYHRMMADQVRTALPDMHRATGRPVRIVEVGAGTGASSAFVLAACADSGVPVEYRYTDISSAFLRRGEDAFAARFPFLRCELLDIERDPVDQGFAEHGYDVVLATNVLHATARVPRTLANARRLLRPGGLLLVNEVTRVSAFVTLTFGLTPGWWRAEDAAVRLPHSPLLGPAQWRRSLAAAGFDPVRTLGFAGTAPDDLEQCLFVAVAAGATGGPAGDAVRGYVRKVFAEVLRFRDSDLDDRVTFENYGVDSLVSLDILGRFERDLGTLPATLLFEHLTIADLAGHFAATHPEALVALLGVAAAPPAPAPRTALPAGATRSAVRDGDIAVVGVVGRYPGAADLDEFWHMLADGRTGVTEVPAHRWDWRTHFDPEKGRAQRTYSRWGGFLDGIDEFDPGFFGILPRDAENIDPQERLFLETAWNLLEQTGYLGEHTREPDTGVFVGTMYGSYGQLAAAGWAHGQLAGATSAYWSIANRVSYFLDLRGPSFAVDSACSSSLLAVHLASESIRRGECRMAIAGGVNVILHPAHFVALSGLNMLSADGRCKVFDARADGFVPGEGVGAVLLKPLSRAVADGDRIWGVIRSGFANAGGKTGGYTVPNPNAQAALVAEAVRRAGVDPATIGYVEAHGTGTELGDPIELAGLSRALGAGTPGGVRCAIGSVKANVGHLEGAAGIAGLTKVLLQLRHGQLAPCANLDEVNPKIELNPDRCYLPTSLTAWPRADGPDGPVPRRAGVSSFGAGGANVHLVVEEYADAESPRPAAPLGTERVFVLSARTRDQLAAFADRVARFLVGPAGAMVDLDALCYTSQVGRRELAERLAVPVRDTAALAAALAAFAGGTTPEWLCTGTAARSDAPVDRSASPADIAARWVRGAAVDWPALWPAPVPRRIPFPTYPFERKRYWMSGPAPATVPAPAAIAAPVTVDAEAVCRFQRPVWVPRAGTPAVWHPRVVLVVTADLSLAEAVAAALRHSGTRCVTAVSGPRLVQAGSFGYAFDPAADDQCAELAQALARRGLLPDTLVHAVADAGSAGSDGLAADLDRGLYPFLRLCTALLGERPQGPLRAVFAHPSRVDGPAPQHVAVAAAVRTLALEHTGFSGTRVEFAHTDGVPPSAAERAARLADEVTAGGRGDMEVCYRDGLRWVKRLEDFTPAPAGGPIVRPGGTYLITGGAGGLGLHVAGYLAGDGPVEVVLAGRKQPGPEAAQRIAALCRSGASVRFERADVTREDELRRLVRDCGTLRGIVHAAGVTRDARAVHKTRADIAAVLAPKVLGTVLLDEVTADAPLDFFALFSSVAAETGNPGQVDYAAANAFLNAFAQLREVRRERGERSGRTVAFGWPLWAEGGMTVDDATRRLMARHWSMVPMRTAVGLDAFRRGLSGGESTFVVVESVATPPEAAPAEVAPAVAAPVAAASTERLQETVEDRLRGMAATFLLIDPVEVELSDDLMETGFDSISLTELINQVNEAYGLDLLPTVLFECANLRAFAEYLVRHHATEIGGGTAPAERVPVPGPETRPAVAVPDGAVAIVGIAGTLPGSPDLDTFWRHLAAGDDLVGPAPADRLELHAHPDTAGVRAGFLDDVATFDAELFRISPAEAALMDPQQRLFLQTVWRAVEDAGYRPGSLAGTDTGLFVGVSTTDYADLLRQHGIPVAAHTASGIAHSILANRVSHVLDLRGPSEAVDTACSSSLVAIHRAVQALAAGDCTVAVAGGVNVLLSPGLFTAFTESGMLSPDGACKTFDSGADGYARGEGVGAVVLKPLAAAEACGDHIYAVIRGSAVNHGGRSTSLTAPNPQAQARVLVRAYRTAGVDPLTVTAIEAHGTGTRLGDPVEIEGLKKAFAELTGGQAPQEPTVAVGSVKTNVGHLEAAAGIAGILKTVLAMRYGLLPPSLHFTEPNPYLRLDGTPFFVNDRLRRWDGVPDGSGGAVRRAGVSSFGFGGTNAHVVLESHAVPPPAAVPGEPQLLVLSGRDEPSVRTAAAALADHLERHPDTDLARAAHTLQTGREPLAHRLAVVASEPVEAVHALRAAATGTPDGTVPTTGVPALDDLARRWLAGEDVSWDEWWHGREPGRTPLPGQPLSGRPYWFDGRAQRAGEEAAVPEPAQPQAIPAAVRHRGGKVSLVPPSNGAAPVAPAETATPVVPAVAEPTPVEPAPVRGRDVAAAVRGRDVTAAVRGHVADILGLTADEVDAGRSFVDLGLDSIFRMDLARRLNATFSLDLQAAELYEYDTVDQLAAHLTAAAPDVAPQAMPVPAEALRGAVQRIVDRTVDPALDFTANGLTSFDMLRVVSALERRFGALPKTLLFDHPSVDALAGQLAGTHGASATVELLRAVAAEEVPVGSPEDGVRLGTDADARPAADGAVVVRKRDLVALPHLAGALDDIDRRHGKEGGLAGRDIAPLAFVGSTRQAYFNFSRRGADLFAWSYAGSADEFPVLVGEWLDYAGRYGLRANFLSMLPMREVAGVPLTATPFGAVQRITDLAEFTLDGGRMTRLRYLVRKFEHAGDCRTEEYRPGSDTTTDREIADMVGRWGDQKQMVNPYVAVVRDELGHGILDARHRVFLTRVDGELANVVIVTRIPSEPGYLLDLEFYPKKAPRGGLEYAIVSILERLRDEGYPMFSFGASFGVKVCDSPNAAPDVEEGLDELRSVGIFGTGNFQFKNKFRPTNLPIYLCQRADEPHTSVADVILMIANPDTAATAPGMLTAPDAEPQPARPAPQPATEVRPASGTGQLAACGYNPLALRHADVAVDLITDSWAELDSPAILARATQLHDRARRAADPAGFPMPDWLPFDHAVPTGSGRQAEALLCRNWPGPRGTVIHTELFPTWALSLADAGFTALRTPTAADRRPRTTELFQGDLDLAQLRSRLAATNGGVSFVCVELSGNAGGGYPISMANLRAVREAAVRHGVPVVVDATRIVENAMFITGHEDGWRGRDVWAVVRELLALADTATFSLSKDFGVPAGGLVATRTAALADRLREHEALRGRETGLLARKLLACALDDRAAVAAGVAVRMDAVRTLWTALADAGVPVVAPASGHCVLLDVDRMPSFAGLSLPVESCLAWLYGRTGVRGGPHLSKGAPERYLRLAVPVGFSVAQAADVAERLVALWRDPDAVPDLVAVQSAGPVGSRYHPAGELPDDIEAAMREGHRPKDDNAAVLRERAPAAERTLLRVPDGEVEVFSAGTGPVLLLVPPFNIGAGVFAEQYAALPDRYRLVTVHHPGVGATTAAADLTLDGIAALYRTALDRLGERGPVHVLGSSFGGLVAQAFALRFPQDCASLVLVGSSYKVGNRHGEVNRLSVVAREDFDRITANGGPARLRDERAGLEELLLRCESMDPRIGLSYLDVFAAQPTLFARLPEIAVPTLILHGRHDTVVPVKAAHLLHGAIPDARYVELAGAGHFPCLTHPDEVHRLLLEFLRANDERRFARCGTASKP
ncbi:MAG: SDR family NAD(P)-dependent oxidoreductase, partial [Actinobacteria bacterium]